MNTSIGAAAGRTPSGVPFYFHYLPQLDGLRGLAILLVLSGHWTQFSASPLGGFGNSLAQLGVLLFFVLSGFLITGLLLQERERRGHLDLKAFYIRRLLRLGPAFVLFLLTCAVLAGFRLLTDIPRYEFVVCLVYVRNIFGRSESLGHLWSLSLEEQFYMLWPLSLKLIPSARLFAAASLALISVAMLRTAGIVDHWYPYESGMFYLRPWFRFDSILAGCCIGIALVKGGRAAQILEAVVSHPPPLALWGSLLTWTLFGEQLSHALFISGQVLLTSLAVAQLITRPRPNPLLVLPGFVFLGKVSYSLYLWQQLFLVVRQPGWGILREFPANVITPTVLAVVSFYLIEKPALALKQHWLR